MSLCLLFVNILDLLSPIIAVYLQVLSMLCVVAVAGALGGYVAASAAAAACMAARFEDKEPHMYYVHAIVQSCNRAIVNGVGVRGKEGKCEGGRR